MSKTMSHRLSAAIPSMRMPASNEMTSASELEWDTAVCFLHIQHMGTNVFGPMIAKNDPFIE